MPQEELSFTYFPENYRWSHGLLIGLNMAPWGGAEIGEVNRVGLRLKTHIGDDDAWFEDFGQGPEGTSVIEAGIPAAPMPITASLMMHEAAQ